MCEAFLHNLGPCHSLNQGTPGLNKLPRAAQLVSSRGWDWSGDIRCWNLSFNHAALLGTLSAMVIAVFPVMPRWLDNLSTFSYTNEKGKIGPRASEKT